jgi:hypothetical protein
MRGTGQEVQRTQALCCSGPHCRRMQLLDRTKRCTPLTCAQKYSNIAASRNRCIILLDCQVQGAAAVVVQFCSVQTTLRPPSSPLINDHVQRAYNTCRRDVAGGWWQRQDMSLPMTFCHVTRCQARFKPGPCCTKAAIPAGPFLSEVIDGLLSAEPDQCQALSGQ